jgi:hypothetical protein
MHVISGTHWDREWRYTFEQSKLRLADLIDKLLDVLEQTPDYKCFHIDGGMVVLEDYLSVRPQNEDRLRALAKSGRIQFVGWYTLPDMFIVAGESIVRNLLVGKRLAVPYGGAMKAGYTATSYGQTSQLPQIYRGFGMRSALFYRGTNRHQAAPIFLWEGRDGSRLYVIRGFDEVTRTNWFFYVHQPLVFGKKPRDLGYSYDPTELPVHMADENLYENDFQALKERRDFDSSQPSLERALRNIRRQAQPYAIEKHILALDMDDNAKPFSKLPDMIRALSAVADDIDIIPDTFDNYVDTVLKEVKESNLKLLRGEVRQTAIEPGFNGLFGMVTSSRVYLKIANERAETWLAYLAEPLSSLASILSGWEYPRINLDRAWLDLLQNHAHDSICGSGIDQVHRDMMSRFTQTITVGQEVTRRACESLWKRIDQSNFHHGDQTLTFFNTLPQKRKDVFQVVIDLPRPPKGGGYVDPCSGLSAVEDDDSELDLTPHGGRTPGQVAKAEAEKNANVNLHKGGMVNYDYFDIVDDRGRVVPSQILSREETTMRIEREYDSAIGFEADRLRILIEAELPSLGYRTYALRPRRPNYVLDPQPGSERGLIAAPDGVLENEFLRVELRHNGTFSLTHKESGHTFHDLHYFTNSGSIGNAHLDRRPVRDTHFTSLGCHSQLTMVESNSLRGIWKIDTIFPIPVRTTDDGRERLRATYDMPITTWITLRKGSRRLDVRTRIFNQARDHRLILMFPTDLGCNDVAVESAFSVERRNILWTQTGDNNEKHYPFQPMQNFVDVSDGRVGMAFINRGIREYSVLDDRRRTLGITLLRTHRAYMTSTSRLTLDELDRYTGSHCFGQQEYRYSLYPHMGDWREGNVLQEAYDHKVPVHIVQGVPKKAELPHKQSILEILPHDIVMLSAFAQSEDGKAYILRIWNSREQDIVATLQSTLPFRTAKKTRLDEDETETEYKFSRSGKLQIPMRKAEIITLRLEP